jgi:hypothetical protein
LNNNLHIFREFQTNQTLVEKFIAKNFDFFVAPGKNLTQDLLFIRDRITFLSNPEYKLKPGEKPSVESKIRPMLIYEVTLFLPDPLLENKAEFVDTPGYGDALPSRKLQAERMRESAKIVWIIPPKDLQHREHEQDLIIEFTNKVIIMNRNQLIE